MKGRHVSVPVLDVLSFQISVLDRITLKLNAVMGTGREVHQLKQKMAQKHKKKAWKDLAAKRLAVRATGGGPCLTPLIKTTKRMRAFSGMLTEPLHNRFDADAVPSEGKYSTVVISSL